MKTKSKTIVLVLFAAALMGTAGSVRAAVVYWDAGGSADTEWNTGANWEGNTVPASGDTGILASTGHLAAATATITDAVTVAACQLAQGTPVEGNLTLSGSAASLTCTSFDAGNAWWTSRGNLVLNGGTITVSGDMYGGSTSGHQATNMLNQGTMTVGGVFNNRGRLTISNVTLSVGSIFIQQYGAYVQNGGSVTCNASMKMVGDSTRSDSGTNGLNGGSLTVKGGGIDSTDAFRISSNFVLIADGIRLGSLNATNPSTWTISGGVITNSADMFVGQGAGDYNHRYGILTQTGGRVRNNAYLQMARQTDGNAYGKYVLDGGSLEFGSAAGIYMGDRGCTSAIELNCSSPSAVGVISNTLYTASKSGDIYMNLYNASYPSGQSSFRGHGTVYFGNILDNGGRIIADGVGQDNTLDMSRFSVITNSRVNVSSNGWYAQNHGALQLPNISASGSTTKYWGKGADGLTPNLVNSMQLTLTGAAGTLTNALLAADHGSVSPGLFKPIGIWDFKGLTFSTCALTIRYDDAKAASLSLVEDNLKVYQYVNGAWKTITASIDPTANTITANAESPISQIAVDSIPPRGTIVRVR